MLEVVHLIIGNIAWMMLAYFRLRRLEGVVRFGIRKGSCPSLYSKGREVARD